MAIFLILNFLHAAMLTKTDLHYNYFVNTELESKVSFLNFKINSLSKRIFHLIERVQSQHTKSEDISVFDVTCVVRTKTWSM